MLMGSLGFMIGTGGSALVAKTLGEGDREKANQYFSLLIYTAIAAGVVLTAAGLAGIRPIAILMGANGAMIEDCVLYGRILLLSMTSFMLQNVFQSCFVAAEKPQIGLFITVGAGLSNIVLDFLFIVVFHWGLPGAAIATAISQVVGGVIPVFYFVGKNSSLLRLTKAKFDGPALVKACANGSSELMSNVSMFLGYAIGSAPVIGYHYGAENSSELKNLFRKSLTVIGVCGDFISASPGIPGGGGACASSLVGN